MGKNDAVAEPLRERERDAFREAARTDKDEGRAVRLDQAGDPVVDLRPHLVGRDVGQFVARNGDGQLHRPTMADVDDRRSRTGSRQIFRHLFDGFDGRG